MGLCFFVAIGDWDIELSSPVDLLSRRKSLMRFYSGTGDIEVRDASRCAPARFSRPIAARCVDARHYIGEERRILPKKTTRLQLYKSASLVGRSCVTRLTCKCLIYPSDSNQAIHAGLSCPVLQRCSEEDRVHV